MGVFDSLCGYRTIYGPDGKPLPERGRFKVVGAVVADDELTKTTVITFPPSLLDTATNLPTPRTIVLRDASGGAAFGGTVAVHNFTVDGYLSLLGAGAFAYFGGPVEFQSEVLFDGAAQFDGGLSTSAVCEAAQFILSADATETRVLDVAPTFAAGTWNLDPDLVATNLAPGTVLSFPLRVPAGAVLLNLQVRIQGATGHGALPGTLPIFRLKKFPFSSGAASTLIGVGDPSQSVSAYQTGHLAPVDCTGGGQSSGFPVSPDVERYILEITAESGANALAGAKVFGVQATWKRPAGSKIGQD